MVSEGHWLGNQERERIVGAPPHPTIDPTIRTDSRATSSANFCTGGCCIWFLAWLCYQLSVGSSHMRLAAQLLLKTHVESQALRSRALRPEPQALRSESQSDQTRPDQIRSDHIISEKIRPDQTVGSRCGDLGYLAPGVDDLLTINEAPHP